MVICWRYKFSWKSCVKIRSCNEIALILKSWNLEGRPEESSKCSVVQISLLSKFDVWKFSNDKLKKLLLILLLSEVNMWKVNIVLEDLTDRNPQTFRAPLHIAVKISGLHFTLLSKLVIGKFTNVYLKKLLLILMLSEVNMWKVYVYSELLSRQKSINFQCGKTDLL